MFTVPLIDLIPNSVQLVTDIIELQLSFNTDDPFAIRPGSMLALRIKAALLKISRLPEDSARRNPYRVMSPAQSGLAGSALVAAFLGDTPYHDLLNVPVPFQIPNHLYAEHGCCFAPSGWGKTQLLQTTVLGFLNQPDPPPLFIIDSHGEVLKKIEALEHFHPEHGRLRNRLLIIDPENPTAPPLNFFALGPADLSGYSQFHRRALTTGINSLFMYLFTALDREFTGAQATTVTYLLRLLREIDRPTLHTLCEIMDDPADDAPTSLHAAAIARLDTTAQRFFNNEFFSRTMRPNRRQIASRLYSLLQNQTFETMFTAPGNCFNAFEAMQQKSIVLINTSRLTLDRQGASIFGRFFIAQILAAAFQRITVPESERHLALLIIDEASYYFDDQIKFILEEARKYNLGLLFFAQEFAQLTDGVRQALASTSIKFAGPVDPSPARYLAETMKTSTEFLASLEKHHNHHTEFATFVRSLTPHALRLSVPFGTLERAPAMSAKDNQQLRTRNHQNLAATMQAEQASSPQPSASQHPAPPRSSAPAPRKSSLWNSDDGEVE